MLTDQAHITLLHVAFPRLSALIRLDAPSVLLLCGHSSYHRIWEEVFFFSPSGSVGSNGVGVDNSSNSTLYPREYAVSKWHIKRTCCMP